MKTYEIPTANGYKTVQANSKQEALGMVSGATLKAPISSTAPKSSTSPTGNVITSAGLQTNPQPFNVKTPPSNSQAPNLSADIQAGADTFTQSLQDKATKAEGTKNTALEDYLTSIVGQKGQTEMTADAYSKTVDPLESELVDINNQIMAEQNANRRKLADLDKNPQGLFGGALQDEKNRVERESLAKQADLSVIQMARQGKYDSAKAIADRAVAVRLEQQKNELDALKLNYEENKDLFDKTEQRAFDSMTADRQRKLDKEEADLKEISDLSITALQNGAPSSIAVKMRSAKTPEEAIRIGGGYIMSIASRKAQAELSAMNNPVGVQVPKTVSDLKATDRTPLVDSRSTLTEVSEMQDILNRNANNLAVLETGTSDDARRFLQLRSNIVDKLARERTGAVIGNDEKRDFKRILGVGLRQLATKDIEEVNKGLETFKDKHRTVVKLIDPDGSISSFLDSQVPVNVADSIINQYSGKTTGSSTLNSY